MKNRITDNALRFLGFGLGVLLLFHGIDKVSNGIEFIEKMLNSLKVPYAQYVSYGVYVGEVLAPLFLIVGQYMRTAAMVVAINMLVAMILVHKEDFWTLGEHGAWSVEVPMLYLVMALSIVLWKVPKAKTS